MRNIGRRRRTQYVALDQCLVPFSVCEVFSAFYNTTIYTFGLVGHIARISFRASSSPAFIGSCNFTSIVATSLDYSTACCRFRRDTSYTKRLACIRLPGAFFFLLSWGRRRAKPGGEPQASQDNDIFVF